MIAYFQFNSIKTRAKIQSVQKIRLTQLDKFNSSFGKRAITFCLSHPNIKCSDSRSDKIKNGNQNNHW